MPRVSADIWAKFDLAYGHELVHVSVHHRWVVGGFSKEWFARQIYFKLGVAGGVLKGHDEKRDPEVLELTCGEVICRGDDDSVVDWEHRTAEMTQMCEVLTTVLPTTMENLKY